MPRYLIVANETLGGAELLAEVERRVAAGDCAFHLVVPVAHGRGSWTEGGVRADAEPRLAEAIERFRGAGATEVTGEVGDASPVRAVGDVLLRGEAFDEIIVSTHPRGVSRWLRQDVPHRMRVHGLPVTHVAAAAAPTPR